MGPHPPKPCDPQNRADCPECADWCGAKPRRVSQWTVVAVALLVVVIATLCGGTTTAEAAYDPAPQYLVTAAQRDRMPPAGTAARRAWIVCHYFPGRLCRPALNVAWCESDLKPWAVNGEHRGIFQMGSGERARWGHGPTAWQQAPAARRYFNYARRIGWRGGWGPWSCRP